MCCYSFTGFLFLVSIMRGTWTLVYAVLECAPCKHPNLAYKRGVAIAEDPTAADRPWEVGDISGVNDTTGSGAGFMDYFD